MFPLGTVLLPHMVLPLQVFEPRYRELLRTVLDGDRAFGVTLITRGHEVGGGDQRSDVGTVARIIQAEQLEDGRWTVAVVGVRRILVERWHEDLPYPSADVVDLPDEDRDLDGQLPAELVDRLRHVLAMHAELGHSALPSPFELEDDPAVAAWQVAVLAPLTPFDAQRVLATTRCSERTALLDALLRDLEELFTLQLRAGGPA